MNGAARKNVIAVRANVPRFLTIRAQQIEDWADRIEARQLLPVLLRKLIHSTGRELRRVDFPGYDNAERKGWDGTVVADAATAWVPEGRSCWEFGTNRDPATKGERDYTARVASVPANERAECTFCFVTPRNWEGKVNWENQKNASREWKRVMALDASDLEQWLEESIPAQIWLAERLAIPVSGFETLDQCWRRWASASDPQLTPGIFEGALAAYKPTFKEWIDKASDRPFVVAADSKDEGLAFVACLFQESEIAPRAQDLAAVFESGQTLRTVAATSASFIPIVSSEEAERELTGVYRRLHCIVVRPRSAIDSDPDIALDLLSNDAFEKALAAMGIQGDEAERLARESGCSPTILRRRLSRVDAIRIPPWARDTLVARSLIPMTLVGAWHAQSNADCEVLSALASRPYQEIEERLVHLLNFDDCPVWSVGQYRGVASKIDSLFAIAKVFTEKDLNDFFLVAEYVLAESDPALELPEDRRWAASIHGKLRDHSAALRQGVCETLVIMAVHGNNLFRDRLGIDVEGRVSLLISRLLTPLTLDRFLSHNNDLPRYAEAAPDEFLGLLENDLRQPAPVVLGLLKPAETGVLGVCHRTGLLWALECLAWKPQNLPRVVAVLAQLSGTAIEDNWASKPIASLKAIFRTWMPQTAASLEDRKKALEMLVRTFPDVGWQICVEQFEPGPQTGDYSYRPRWRSDASGAGQPAPKREAYEFSRKALDLTLFWLNHNENTLGALVECLQGIPEEDQEVVWDQIKAWIDAEADDRAKAALRERIRRTAFTRRARRRGMREATRDRAREVYEELQPRDPVMKHAWLFADQWVEDSAEELENEDYDFSEREERIGKLRAAAVREIWDQHGFDSIQGLLAVCGAPHAVGQYVAACLKGTKASIQFVKKCLALDGDLIRKADECIRGFLWASEATTRATILPAVASGENHSGKVRLFCCAPFSRETWRAIDRYGEDVRDAYWREVFPHGGREDEADLIEMIDRLLKANRPRAAFHAVRAEWPKIETSRLKRLLVAVGTVNEEPTEHYKLDPYDISQALESLDRRNGVSPDEMAQLEFMFMEALRYSRHGIPNLERQIAESPAIFVQAVAFAYERSDTGEDPPEWRIDDPERRAAAAHRASRLLKQVRRIPGTVADGKINAEALSAWIGEVQRLCAQHARAELGDQKIGQLLSNGPADEDGLWPCRPVCEAMERLASQQIAIGFQVGTLNSRGVHGRGEGGEQERELAAKYRDMARLLDFDFPYVSSVLEGIAASYGREAEWHDSDARVRKRLKY